MTQQPKRGGKAGMGVDATGGPVIDPTENVVALVKAEAKAAAMLRKADTKYNDAMFRHLKEIGALRARNAETSRLSDLDRLAKTREVDVTTSAAQAEQLATAVQTLAVNNDKNAEAIRNQMNSDRAALAKQVTDTATTLGANNDSAMKDVNNRIAELQKSQYQGVGKSSVADPMMAEFVSEMRMLIKGQAASGGKSEGMSDSVKALMIMLAIVTAFMGFYTFTQKDSAATAPQVIYVPAPTGTQLPVTPPAQVPR
jgi:hypothetical protein